MAFFSHWNKLLFMHILTSGSEARVTKQKRKFYYNFFFLFGTNAWRICLFHFTGIHRFRKAVVSTLWMNWKECHFCSISRTAFQKGEKRDDCKQMYTLCSHLKGMCTRMHVCRQLMNNRFQCVLMYLKCLTDDVDKHIFAGQNILQHQNISSSS